MSLLTELKFFYRFELSGRVDSRLGVDRDDGRTVDEHSILFSTEGFECRGPTYVRTSRAELEGNGHPGQTPTDWDALPSVSLLTALHFFSRFELSDRVDSHLGVGG